MEDLSLHRTALDHDALVVVQRVEPRLEQRPDRRRHVDRAACLSGEGGHLLEEQRIAVRGRHDAPARLVVELDVGEEAVGKPSSVRLGERLEEDRRGVQLAAAPARPDVEELGSRDAEEEDRRGTRPVDDVLDEVEHRLLRPVEVVDHEHERPLAGALLEEGTCRELRLGRRGPDRLRRLDLELHEHLHERPVRDPLAVRERAAPRHRGDAVDVLEDVRDEPRLADPGRADQREQTAAARRDHVLEVRAEPRALALAAHHRALEAACDADRAGVQAVQPVRRHLARLPLQRELERLGRDGVSHEAQAVVAEQDLARSGSLLEPGGDVDRVTRDERVALARDDRPRVDPDPRVQPQLLHDVAQLHRRARRPQRVVLGRDGDPEHGHHGVADELLYPAAVPLEHPSCGVVVPVHQRSQRLRIRPLSHRRRPGQVAEQHRYDLPHLPAGYRSEGCAAAGTEDEVVGALAPTLCAHRHAPSLRPAQERVNDLRTRQE